MENIETKRVFLTKPNEKFKKMKSTEIIKKESNEQIKDYFEIYFIETHLLSEDIDIEILLDSSNKYLKQLQKINEKQITNNYKVFISNVYSMILKPNLIKKKEIIESDKTKTINIKIFLTKNKNKFESNNIVNIEQDNFLINLKFESLKGWFGKTMIPPENIELSNLQVIDILNESFLIKEKKKKNDNIYLRFIEYGINLLKKSEKYELESFLILYINIVNGGNHLLIQEIFDLFEIERIIKEKSDSNLLKYQDKLDNLYKDQYNIIEAIDIIIKDNIYKSLEYYLIKFYTIYIYYIYILGLYQYLEDILKDLRDHNKYISLYKLYLSDYYMFYKNIPISNDIKNSLIKNLLSTSTSFNDLILSFNLISEYTKEDFINILLIINENYEKINKICLKEKKFIIINDYIKNNKKDNLSIIKEYLNSFKNKINHYNFKPIIINIEIWNFYLLNTNNNEFFTYLKTYLIETSIDFKDVKDSLHFLSNFKNKQIIPLLEEILNYYENIQQICEKENKIINISEYIGKNINEDLSKIKELINSLVNKVKMTSYHCIKFDINIWNPYLECEDLNNLKLIKKIISNLKEIDECLDFNFIKLNKKIHDIGLNLIKKEQLIGEELLLFLGEDEVFYSEQKYNDLENENNLLKDENNKLKNQVNKLLEENISLKNEVNKVESNLNNINNNLNDKIKDLRNENEILKLKINKIESYYSLLEKKIDSIKVQ